MKLLFVFILSFSCFCNSFGLRQLAVQKKIEFTKDQQRILDDGIMSDASYYAGAILGTYPLGFGLGHAIQGRYSSDGWKFTLGEVASILVLFRGISDCEYGIFSSEGCSNDLINLGVLSLVGFRIWEIVDLWAVPTSLDKKKDTKTYNSI